MNQIRPDICNFTFYVAFKKIEEKEKHAERGEIKVPAIGIVGRPH